MRCPSGRLCPQPNRCELVGCEGAAPAPDPMARHTIAADAKRPLGLLERLAVRLVDRLDPPKPAPPPAAPIPAPLPEAPAPEPAPIEEPPMSDTNAATGERRIDASNPLGASGSFSGGALSSLPLRPAAKPRDLRIISVPTGGFIIIEDNAPIAIGVDAAGIGASLTRVLQAS